MKIIINRMPNKFDIVNSIVNSKTFQKSVGSRFLMTGYAIYEKNEKNENELEEIKTVTVIKDHEGNYYSSIGQTAYNSIAAIDTLNLSDDELKAGVTIDIKEGHSKQGRTFVYASLVEEDL